MAATVPGQLGHAAVLNVGTVRPIGGRCLPPMGSVTRAGNAPARAAFGACSGWSTRSTSGHSSPLVHVPTLVIHRRGERLVPVEAAQYLASHIPQAALRVLDGDDHFPHLGDQESWLAELREFMTGSRAETEPNRLLATVLFNDLVSSTAQASSLGDRVWRSRLDEHDWISQRVVDRHRGVFVKSKGDGLLSWFDGPGRAVRCAVELRDQLAGAGMQRRFGLHAGGIDAATMTSPGWPSISPPESSHRQLRARCSSLERSRTFSSERESISSHGADTGSKASTTNGSFWPSPTFHRRTIDAQNATTPNSVRTSGGCPLWSEFVTPQNLNYPQVVAQLTRPLQRPQVEQPSCSHAASRPRARLRSTPDVTDAAANAATGSRSGGGRLEFGVLSHGDLEGIGNIVPFQPFPCSQQ